MVQWLTLRANGRETWVRIPAESGGIFRSEVGSYPERVCYGPNGKAVFHAAESDTLDVSVNGDATRCMTYRATWSGLFSGQSCGTDDYPAGVAGAVYTGSVAMPR